MERVLASGDLLSGGGGLSQLPVRMLAAPFATAGKVAQVPVDPGDPRQGPPRGGHELRDGGPGLRVRERFPGSPDGLPDAGDHARPEARPREARDGRDQVLRDSLPSSRPVHAADAGAQRVHGPLRPLHGRPDGSVDARREPRPSIPFSFRIRPRPGRWSSRIPGPAHRAGALEYPFAIARRRLHPLGAARARRRIPRAGRRRDVQLRSRDPIRFRSFRRSSDRTERRARRTSRSSAARTGSAAAPGPCCSPSSRRGSSPAATLCACSVTDRAQKTAEALGRVRGQGPVASRSTGGRGLGCAAQWPLASGTS